MRIGAWPCQGTLARLRSLRSRLITIAWWLKVRAQSKTLRQHHRAYTPGRHDASGNPEPANL
eukprot:1337811-Alexandrium_andersonii.AAC.1